MISRILIVILVSQVTMLFGSIVDSGQFLREIFPPCHTSWSYDIMDRPTRAANEAAVLGWGYDGPSGVLTSTTQQNLAQPGQPVYTTQRIYDATHTRLEQMVYPSGDTVDYTYDDAGRVTGLAHAGSGAAADVGAYAFTYDERGLPETMTAPNGLVTRYWRDKAGRVVAQKTVRQSDSAVVLQEEYGYDSVFVMQSLLREDRRESSSSSLISYVILRLLFHAHITQFKVLTTFVTASR